MVLPYSHPWKALTSGFMLALTIAAVCYASFDETALQMATRWTERAPALLFLPVFVARPLVDLVGANRAGWLRRHRSGFGLALAGNHHLHMVFLTIYLLGEGMKVSHLFANPALYIYIILIAMNLTSFPSLARAMPRPLVQSVHVIGLYALAIAFFETLMLSQILGEESGLFRLVYSGAFAICLAVRVAARAKRWRARTV